MTPFKRFLTSLRTSLSLLAMFALASVSYAQIPASYCDGNPADWANFQSVYPISGYKLDPANAVNNTDDQFTQGSKDEQQISSWRWSFGSANAKGDITNAAAALVNGCILRFAADRTADNGDASIGFWFFRNPVTRNGNGTFTGSHANGDLLILSDFTSGGRKPTIKVYEWINGALVLQNTSAASCADVNHTTANVPAGFTYTASNGSTQYAPNVFFEGAIDLCALQLPTCFSYFLVETRNSQSITASLQDFAANTFNATPPAPTANVAHPSCTVATGTITVLSPLGSGYTYSIDGTNFQSGTTFSGLAPGTYTLTVSISGCTSSSTVVVNPPPPTPARPVVTLQEATICGTVANPTVTVSCPIVGTYTLKQTGQADQTFSYNGSNGPVVFIVKAGIGGFTIYVVSADGCVSGVTDCTNYTSNSCPQATTVARTEVKTIELVAPKTKVRAAPNPYNDRIRFTLQSDVSGQGTLEVFNMLGQKVKTVYQGHIEKGRDQNIECQIPYAQRSNLIYVFRVGDQRTSGKLINLRQ